MRYYSSPPPPSLPSTGADRFDRARTPLARRWMVRCRRRFDQREKTRTTKTASVPSGFVVRWPETKRSLYTLPSRRVVVVFRRLSPKTPSPGPSPENSNSSLPLPLQHVLRFEKRKKRRRRRREGFSKNLHFEKDARLKDRFHAGLNSRGGGGGGGGDSLNGGCGLDFLFFLSSFFSSLLIIIERVRESRQTT